MHAPGRYLIKTLRSKAPPTCRGFMDSLFQAHIPANSLVETPTHATAPRVSSLFPPIYQKRGPPPCVETLLDRFF